MSPSLEEKSLILTPIDLASLEPDAAKVSFLLRDTAPASRPPLSRPTQKTGDEHERPGRPHPRDCLFSLA